MASLLTPSPGVLKPVKLESIDICMRKIKWVRIPKVLGADADGEANADAVLYWNAKADAKTKANAHV